MDTVGSADVDYDVFISYRRVDGRDVAQWLRQRLRRYRLPPALVDGREPVRVYLDTAFERATEDFWLENIEPALRRSRFLMIVVTPSLFEPRGDDAPNWVARELDFFLSQPQGRNILVATACGNPIDRLPAAIEERFPQIDVVDFGSFRGRFGVSGRRQANDRMLTLVSAIYGLADTEMPVLRQEEERRRRQLAVGVATGSMALVVALSALLAFALVQRQRADTSKRKAQHEATAAEADALGLASLRDLDAGRQIQALVEAVEAGRKLVSLAGRAAPLGDYPVASPLLALNRSLDEIRERNILEHRENPIDIQAAAPVVGSGRCRLPAAAERAGLAAYMGQRGSILTHGCTPDGRYLVTTATDGTVRVLDLRGGTPQLIGLQGGATVLRFATNPARFATVNTFGTRFEWDMSGANPAQLVSTLPGDKATVTAIAFSRDGSLVATGAEDGNIRVWSPAGRPVGAPMSGGGGSILALRFSGDGRRLLSVDATGAVREWNLAKRAQTNLLVAGGNVTATAATIRGDGRAVAKVTAGVGAEVDDLRTQRSVSVGGSHEGWIFGIAFAPRTGLVATAGADDTVGLSRQSGQAVGSPIRAGQDQILAVAFSPTGTTLATAGEDGTVRLWTTHGQEVGRLIGHEGKVLDVRFSPDGHLLATAGFDGTVRLWLPTGAQIAQLPGYSGSLAVERLGGDFGTAGLAFDPRGGSIAVTSKNGAVRIYRLQTLGELLDRACAWLHPYLASHHDAPPVCA